jgi:hypothetical protein
MEIEAYPTRLVAVSDGVFGGEEHVVLFLEHPAAEKPYGFALKLRDARRLLAAVGLVLPAAQRYQEELREAN